jgi:hypothetical protein
MMHGLETLNSAVHDSGDVFDHHQEHLIVFAVSDRVHPGCCRQQLR